MKPASVPTLGTGIAILTIGLLHGSVWAVLTGWLLLLAAALFEHDGNTTHVKT